MYLLTPFKEKPHDLTDLLTDDSKYIYEIIKHLKTIKINTSKSNFRYINIE